MYLITFLFSLLLFPLTYSAPEFDRSAPFHQTLIPFDAPLNSVIYRLRAFDPTIQYPLLFTHNSTTIAIEALNCTHLNSICQANVILIKKLEIDRFYDFTVRVANQKGETAEMSCSFKVTNATTPINEIFPGAPTLLMVAENARRNTELGSIIARGSFDRNEGVVMELYGSGKFGLHQKLINRRDAKATIVLLGALDYETTNVHHLTILANNPYSNPNEDTRNIASWPLLVGVVDIQDTPPVFTLAPPTTTLSSSLLPGDPILKVQAEDGDRGNPRPIRYGLVPEGNPFTPFFNLSESTGELRLARPLRDILSISHSNQPIILTVIAEEVRLNPNEPPSQSSTVQLALIPPGIRAGTPIFAASDYSTVLDENAEVGTILDLAQAEVMIEPGNVVALNLEKNNQTFEILPTVVEHDSKFQIRVQNSKFLDYELNHVVGCWIVAKEIGAANFTTRVRLSVVLNDLNDNDPEFTQDEYQGSIPENPKVGTTVLRVEATDIDREPSSQIKYTRLIGNGSELFELEPNSGIITVRSSVLDAEKTPILRFLAEARDENGRGRASTSSIVVNLLDVNDEAPKFEKPIYEFILNPDRDSFTTRALIRANDADVSSPNNEVEYELIKPIDGLNLDPFTGELTLTGVWPQNEIYTTRARAYDGGIPRLSDECLIRIYPPENQSRKMIFIVPGRNPNLQNLEKKLSILTGAKIQIDRIKPYEGSEVGAKELSGGSGRDRSVVYVTATYSDSIIDVNTVKQVFDETTPISKAIAPRGNLLWLLLLLLILALLLAIILIFCCVCQGCPLYVPPKRRKIASAEIKKVVQGSGLGKESKSVQVAEWFGRREAWTPDQESLQRHEQERGSDRLENRRSVKLQREPSREQLYIREGNTDILRLVTRGGDLYDSGKDILMRRFIDQQQSERVKMNEHEILEASLRQQNALLRQILQEREKDLRLETQSLPAGTQTDQDQETQTEPFLLRQTKSDGSDEEDSRKERTRRRRPRLRRLKTPIQEESEVEEKLPQPKIEIKQTRTSAMRQKAASGRSLKKEVLREISASLEYSGEESGRDYYSDSLEEITPRSSKRFHSDSDLRREEPRRSSRRSQSTKPRYMEWYTKSKAPHSKSSSASIKEEKVIKEQTKKLSRLMQETESSMRKKVERKNVGPEHPLLQHSEYRYEAPYVIGGRKGEGDDEDSGIALARLPIAQKKSVFTIAYNDMHTKQLRDNSQSPI